MAIEMLYFAWVREAIGKDGETIEPPPEARTVSDLIDWLSSRGGGYAAALRDRSKLRAALDQAFVSLDTPIGGAREIAIFPPVTGG